MTSLDLKLEARSIALKEIAYEFGFTNCRIAKAGFLSQEANQLEIWLKSNYHGEMDYMSNHFDLRTDPTKLVPGAKSVVVFGLNYFPENSFSEGSLKIAKYAYGKDYHAVIRKKLNALMLNLNAKFGDVHGRGFVDSAPVMEKAWARKSGLGWIGKHTNIITKQKGSFFFLAVLVIDLELAPDDPVKDHCGRCTACIDACPTDAIIEPYQLDASKCISYATIELKSMQIPESFTNKMNDWMFGCDICQDVCPWNRFSKPHHIKDFNMNPALTEMKRKDWFNLKEETFQELFKGSPIKRTKYQGLVRNIRFLERPTFD